MFHAIFYKPMYNALVYIISLLPHHDVATAVVILTLIVKFILLPLSKKMFLTQIAQKKIQPLIYKLQEEYKDNRQMLGMKMMEVYREHKLNPFSSILLMLIQIPIVFALYFVFSRGGLPALKAEDLYSFTPVVENIQHILFGIDFTLPSLYIGLAAAIAQSLQIRLSINGMHPKNEPTQKDAAPRPEEIIQKQMMVMMKYFFPVLIFFVSLKVSAAVALYWIVSSVFMIVQELYFRRKFKLVE